MLAHTETRSFVGSTSSLRTAAFSSSSKCPVRHSLQVRNAITRQKKEEIVETVKTKLTSSTVVFGIRFKGLTVQNLQKFRRGLPEKSSVYVCKNNLMKVACREVPGWSMLEEKGCKGENAWVFVHEDDIAEATKYYFQFEQSLLDAAKAVAAKGQEVKAPTELSCVVMDNKYLTPADFKRCENLPTKQQLYATIARLIRQPAQKIAVGIKMVPTKLAYGIKAIAELDEDKTKTCGEVAKPKTA